MIKKLDKDDKINYFVFVIITILYVFRGILAYYNIDKIIYIISAGTLLYYIFRLNKTRSISKYLIGYFIIIGVSLLFSLIINFGNIIATIAGFLSSYLNFFIAFFFLASIDDSKRKNILSKYLKTLVILGVICAVLGIYQTFIDPSIFGFANNDIYGNPDLLATGNYTIRATAMLGSAQNYGLFVGSTFAIAFFTPNKTKGDYVKMLILLVGILVSGSRSASICIILSIILFAYNKLKNKQIIDFIKTNKKKIVITTGIVIGAAIMSLVIISLFFNLKTVKRLINFDITSAVGIYKDSLSTLEPQDYFFGKGLGYRDWAVNQLIGEEKYTQFFKIPYKSSESYFMLTFLQSGILRIISVITIMVVSVVKTFKRQEYDVLILLACIFVNQIFTPSFSGMAMSFIYYPIIIYPFFNNILKNRKKDKKHE